jgi:hypothetical protein
MPIRQTSLEFVAQLGAPARIKARHKRGAPSCVRLRAATLICAITRLAIIKTGGSGERGSPHPIVQIG